MKAISKSFCQEDQDLFAQLSGDFNPLHVDPVRARRYLFGEQVVHGIHVLLWAYDQVAVSGLEVGTLQSVSAIFKNPVCLGAEVTFEYTENGNELSVRVMADAKIAMQGKFRCGGKDPQLEVVLDSAPHEAPVELDTKSISNASGKVQLGISKSLWARLFPNLAKHGCPYQASVLLATSRLVGMKCPGLNSLFSRVSITFFDGQAQSIDDHLRYRVSSFKSALNIIELKVANSSVTGSITSHYRPPPVTQQSYKEIERIVSPTQYVSQSALIVGGSRGVGEVAAKLIAAGGGKTRISYCVGADEALAVSKEIVADGGIADVINIDVLDSMQVRDALTDCKDITHVYYFASPKIVRNDGSFDDDYYRLLLNYYHHGLLTIIDVLLSTAESQLSVFFPSTAFIETGGSGFAEYVRAKESCESFFESLEKSVPNLRFQSVRLPRLESDQTRGLIVEQFPETALVLQEAFSLVPE